MGTVLSILSGLVQIVKVIFTGKNSAAEVANKTASNVQDQKSQVQKDVAKGDAAATGRDIS